MFQDTLLPFTFPAVGRKKVVAAFEGGRLTSDGGVLPLAAAERRLGLAETLAALIADPRDPSLVTHPVADIRRARMLAIARGYEDGNDLDTLRGDPACKLACGRLPDSGRDLCSQPPLSRWENAPTRHEVAAMSDAMMDLYCASYERPPREVRCWTGWWSRPPTMYGAVIPRPGVSVGCTPLRVSLFEARRWGRRDGERCVQPGPASA
jgi:hypothetical protein